MRALVGIAVFVAMCAAQSVRAADVPSSVSTFYDWSGMYVGINAGYGSGSINDTTNGLASTETFSGVIAGGQIGANFQYKAAVLGLEIDGDWSNQKDSGSAVAINVPWLATARIRVGFSYDRFQYYLTGGAGYLHFTSAAANAVSTTSAQKTWVAGIGQESALQRNLLLRFEVLYLGPFRDAETSAGPISVSSSRRVTDILYRVGLSYKFGGLESRF